MAATVGAQLNVLDPLLYAGDPYPAYQWLRDAAPVYWDPVNEIWGVSRFGTCWRSSATPPGIARPAAADR